MAHSKKSKVNETFSQMFNEMKESGDLYVEWAKINIAEQISLAMKREDVNKAELARRLGKSRAYMTQILQGDVNFTVSSLVRIATTLECDVEVKFVPKCILRHWEYLHYSSKSSDETMPESSKNIAASINEDALAA